MDLPNDLRIPIPFEVYKHFKQGNKYMVIGVFISHQRVAMVSYISMYEPYEKWERSLEEWMEKANGQLRYMRVSNVDKAKKCTLCMNCFNNPSLACGEKSNE